jgi:outer membrane protein assembly factor BamB
MGLAGRLLCCDAESGTPVWYRDMTRHFGGKEPRYGYSESVLVDEGRVICTPGGENTVVALDAQTGRTIWAARAGDPASYASIIKAEFDETPQYVAFTHRGLVGIRASDGEVLWRYDAPSNEQANCNTPVTVGSTVFAASGYGRGGGCAWVRKDDEGKFSAEQLYFTNRLQCQYGGFLVVDKHLYGCGDPGVLVCLNYKTGVVTKALRTGRFSIAYADGMLFLRHENGRVELYVASPTKPVRRASFQQPHRSESKAWPHPVIANGRLYLRDQYVVLCYNLMPESEEPSEEEQPEEQAEEQKNKQGEAEDESKSSEEDTPRRGAAAEPKPRSG